MLPLKPIKHGLKTLVLDMDETMIHCFIGPDKADKQMPFTLPTGERVLGKMNIRPYLKQFLI